VDALGMNFGTESSRTTADSTDAQMLPYNLSWSTLTLDEKTYIQKSEGFERGTGSEGERTGSEGK